MCRITLNYIVFFAVPTMLIGTGCHSNTFEPRELLPPVILDHLPNRPLVYMGATNHVGPGSLWRQRPSGEYALRLQAPDALNAAIIVGEQATLDHALVKLTSDQTELAFFLGLTNFFGRTNAGSLIKNVKSAQVKLGSWRWDVLSESNFEDWIYTEVDERTRQDYIAEDRFVMTAALRVESVSLILSFDQIAAANVNASVESIMSEVARGRYSAETLSDDRMEVHVAGPVYILADFAEMDDGRVRGVRQTNLLTPAATVPKGLNFDD